MKRKNMNAKLKKKKKRGEEKKRQKNAGLVFKLKLST